MYGTNAVRHPRSFAFSSLGPLSPPPRLVTQYFFASRATGLLTLYASLHSMPYPFRGGAQSSRSIASNLSGWKWNTPRGPCKTATSHLQTDRSPTDLASFLERLLCPFLCLVLSLRRVVRRRVPFLSLSPTLSFLVRAAPSSLSVPLSLPYLSRRVGGPRRFSALPIVPSCRPELPHVGKGILGF